LLSASYLKLESLDFKLIREYVIRYRSQSIIDP
jgi:hypothetical protein